MVKLVQDEQALTEKKLNNDVEIKRDHEENIHHLPSTQNLFLSTAIYINWDFSFYENLFVYQVFFLC